jgi:hypothetical protein
MADVSDLQQKFEELQQRVTTLQESIPKPPPTLREILMDKFSIIYKIGPLFSFIHDPRLLFLLSIGLSIYVFLNNHKEAVKQRDDYELLDIQGSFIDRDIHQVNFFVWNGLNQIKRKLQGLSGEETWSLNLERGRFVINDNASSVISNYAEYTGNAVVIKNPSGAVLKTLYRIESFGCNACGSGLVPTYSNFAANFTLARITLADKPKFVNDLDRLRACAMNNIAAIPVGVTSNSIIAEAPLAIAKDNTRFYYIPPTNYGMLLSNGVLELSVTYDQIPYAFCGAM